MTKTPNTPKTWRQVAQERAKADRTMQKKLYAVCLRRVWTTIEEGDIAIEASSKSEAIRLARSLVEKGQPSIDWCEQDASLGRLSVRFAVPMPDDNE